MHRGALTTLVSACAMVVAAMSVVADADETFRARLTGDQEVPPVITDTTGKFKVQVSKDQTRAEYTLRVNEGEGVTQAHFHCGVAGVNGPVIVFLAGFRPEGWDVDGKWVSNATLRDANVILTTTPCGGTLAQIFQAARLGMVYVNAHSVAHPGGVVRGQLEPGDDEP